MNCCCCFRSCPFFGEVSYPKNCSPINYEQEKKKMEQELFWLRMRGKHKTECPLCCPLVNQDIRLSEHTQTYQHTHPQDEKLLSFMGGQLLVVQCIGDNYLRYVLVPGWVVAYHFKTENGILQSYVLPVSKTLRSEVECLVHQFGLVGSVNLW